MMKNWRLAAAFLPALLLAPCTAFSQTDVCERAGQTLSMPDLTECEQLKLNREDARLNAEYKAVMKGLTKVQRTTLRTKQRAWIKKRDKACKLEEDSGQAGLLDHISCLHEWTRKRADEIAAMRK